MADQLDSIIKAALEEEALHAGEAESLYPEIKNRLDKVRKNRARLFNFKKPVSAFVFYSLVIVLLLFGFSGQTKILASEAINAIKTFFVVEEGANGPEVKQKPADEVPLQFSISRTTSLDSSALEKLLGFRVVFPQTLQNKYTLDNKALGLTLDKKLDYYTYMELQDTMFKALEDNGSLKALKEYEPRRNIDGFYNTGSGIPKVFISVRPTTAKIDSGLAESSKSESSKSKSLVTEVKINGFSGYWYEFPIPIYPFKIENGIGTSDMTKPPSEIKQVGSLVWSDEKLQYTVSYSYMEDFSLSMEESIKLAEEFLKAQEQ